MVKQPASRLPEAALLAGYAGLLPQLVAAALVFSGSEYRWTGLAAAYGYAAFIFSFLGGIWWGFGVTARKEGVEAGPIFAVAVAPSLIAFASYLPWIWGWGWPGPSLAWIGFFLMLSPLADRWLLQKCSLPDGWMKLRWHLSLGLGGLTFSLAAVA
ncbi:MAG: DUF3429 domain-containing protein [Sphingomonadaceae bacterium]|nr:DUF3429 domain-containing protein [Sphingomonadaceae bacterium]